MDVSQHKRFVIPDKSYASIAKREISRMAEEVSLSAADIGKLNIVVSELTSNLSKHASAGGELLVRPLGREGIEVICIDRGPGMQDPLRMMEDGVSTYGSAGEGLGAIKRQSDVFDLYSQPELGTVIVTQVYKSGPLRQQASRHDIGYVLVPKPNETFCGDGLAVKQNGAEINLLALDGLGHGAHANEAAQAAVQAFAAASPQYPSDTLRTIHQQIRRTRGAVGLALNISGNSHKLSYCGIGNIAGKLYSPESSLAGLAYKNIISYNGILGHNIPNTLNNQQLDWSRNKTLVLHSDGLRSRWELTKYPHLNRHLATTIAAVLYKEHSRQTDDTLVLVCKSKV
ncbi:anti-sigma regulatory factor (Ser/Thr protein kinase) [Pontibacter ummariensis]|uniref:Anti-sigma regulatory factor (Ser/Thr protein kinase) n=1 Tax=Pontibacter ummariensis TaxID=1610492 RepID=A0A239EVB7_9BACT|nr:ATP-binding protein [Pontibacter ummariensis]PRY12752.1 anti-sigma regulatory factor (Ser/Thr protein kinase) [Pontibacter ummariensis]SNS47993.1 Anti-sigma regulatory factor (Ser/Thr protein kinase) [Pontibacter ummariensis]